MYSLRGRPTSQVLIMDLDVAPTMFLLYGSGSVPGVPYLVLSLTFGSDLVMRAEFL